VQVSPDRADKKKVAAIPGSAASAGEPQKKPRVQSLRVQRRGESNRELVRESAAAWRKRYPVVQETPLIKFGVAF
jgi:hypothetical protein